MVSWAFISVYNGSIWGCTVFPFIYISLSLWVEIPEACLVGGLYLVSEYEMDGRLNSRGEKKHPGSQVSAD